MTDPAGTIIKSIALARISRVIPQIADGTPSPVKGAILDKLLPSLHFLAIVSSLDNALTEYVQLKCIPWPSKTKQDLSNRIDVVSASLPIDAVSLHRIRRRRNEIAHEPESVITASITWTELDSASNQILKATKAMGFINELPTVTVSYERIPTIFPDELGPNGARIKHRHVIGAKCDDTTVLNFPTKFHTFRPAGNPHHLRRPFGNSSQVDKPRIRYLLPRRCAMTRVYEHRKDYSPCHA
jgi:hypothetical protein